MSRFPSQIEPGKNSTSHQAQHGLQVYYIGGRREIERTTAYDRSRTFETWKDPNPYIGFGAIYLAADAAVFADAGAIIGKGTGAVGRDAGIIGASILVVADHGVCSIHTGALGVTDLATITEISIRAECPRQGIEIAFSIDIITRVFGANIAIVAVGGGSGDTFAITIAFVTSAAFKNVFAGTIGFLRRVNTFAGVWLTFTIVVTGLRIRAGYGVITRLTLTVVIADLCTVAKIAIIAIVICEAFWFAINPNVVNKDAQRIRRSRVGKLKLSKIS